MAQIADEVRELLALVTATGPRARDIRAKLEARGAKVSVAGPNLDHPAWASAVGGATDVFAELTDGGDVVGMRVHDDGDSTDVELALRGGTVTDLEAATGPLRAMPRQKPRYSRAFKNLDVGERVISLNVHHDEGRLAIVQLHFNAP